MATGQFTSHASVETEANGKQRHCSTIPQRLGTATALNRDPGDILFASSLDSRERYGIVREGCVEDEFEVKEYDDTAPRTKQSLTSHLACCGAASTVHAKETPRNTTCRRAAIPTAAQHPRRRQPQRSCCLPDPTSSPCSTSQAHSSLPEPLLPVADGRPLRRLSSVNIHFMFGYYRFC